MVLNGVAFKRNTQALEQVMAAVDRIEKQLGEDLAIRMDASSTILREILEEIRAQSQAIFILIDRVPPP